MSTHFYITPYDPQAWQDPEDNNEKPSSDLKIDRVLFHTGLLEHWTPARCLEESDSWILTQGPDGSASGIRVNLWLEESHGPFVAFSVGPKHAFLEFILWYRAYVPASYPLYLFNDSSWAWNRLLLTPETTEQDIIDFTGIVS